MRKGRRKEGRKEGIENLADCADGVRGDAEALKATALKQIQVCAASLGCHPHVLLRPRVQVGAELLA